MIALGFEEDILMSSRDGCYWQLSGLSLLDEERKGVELELKEINVVL